ncbi:cysteine peptidase family C39 domain-containing protein [Pedobacter cryoconitis]|uniref:ABC-type bacteriocin/lantibiotic exporter with double-glycine peptidase domain n=1 Tax=Pedobacter cryoconitis TaxID=188932 RepID=A0A7X0J0Z8_9SPHI|nr:cysteine peptidase family C39 domain-containing protein [Pedobacter cryoconitis]MBB6499048.1 ABC-type bacteriocin/lantibiotic exporter with double-glycine peptidase domain [Pedobacter cryoconitis]
MYKNETLHSFPFDRQQKDNECALSCLKMVSDFYGKHINLEYLREIVLMDPDGVSIYSLVKALNQLNFKSLVVNTRDTTLLNKAILPCIMLWKNNHYVVIYNIADQLVSFADPGEGLRTMDYKEFFSDSENQDEQGWIILLEPKP